MTPEEMDRKIEFILDMQAEFASKLSRSETNIDNLRVTVAGLAEVVRESIKISDDRFTRLDDRFARLDDKLNKLADAQKAADERSSRLDERLNTLITVVERHITGPDHAPRP